MLKFGYVIATFCAACLITASASADTWRATASGDFNSNIWTDGTVTGYPTLNTDVARVYGTGAAGLTITVDSAATTGDLQMAYLGGPSTVSLSTGGTLNVGSSTSYYLALSYGASSTGTFIQTGGALILNSGAKLEVGYSAGSCAGEYDYSGGTISQTSTGITYVSAGSFSAGTFSVSGSGTNNSITLGALDVTAPTDANSTGTLKFALDGGGITPISVTQINFGLGTSKLALSLLAAPPTTAGVPQNITLISDTGAETGAFTGLAAGSAVSATYGSEIYNYTITYSGGGTGHHDVDLYGVSVTPAPEPTTIAPLGLSLVLMSRRRRRRIDLITSP